MSPKSIKFQLSSRREGKIENQTRNKKEFGYPHAEHNRKRFVGADKPFFFLKKRVCVRCRESSGDGFFPLQDQQIKEY